MTNWGCGVPKWAWSGSRDPFLYFEAQTICLERMMLDISNLACRLNVKSITIIHVKLPQYWGASSEGHVTS